LQKIFKLDPRTIVPFVLVKNLVSEGFEAFAQIDAVSVLGQQNAVVKEAGEFFHVLDQRSL
jgi:hypothetical protein